MEGIFKRFAGALGARSSDFDSTNQGASKEGIFKRIAGAKQDADTYWVAVTMVCALGFGVLAVSGSLWDHGTVWRGLLWAGAWSSVGWFLGFLFGIPRYLSTDTARTLGASVLEAGKKELAAAVANAKTLREAADKAAKAKTDANTLSTEKAKDANPDNLALKDDSEANAKAAALPKQASEDATASASTAATKAQTAEEAARQAEVAAEAAKSKVATASKNPTASSGPSLTVNTNLEQISDWLTKIIVGVSLVESKSLLEQMQRAATFMASSMVKADEMAPLAASTAAAASASASNVSGVAVATARSLASVSPTESFAYAVMLYFLVTGLLGSYLLTRLFLQRALDNAARPDSASALE